MILTLRCFWRGKGTGDDGVYLVIDLILIMNSMNKSILSNFSFQFTPSLSSQLNRPINQHFTISAFLTSMTRQTLPFPSPLISLLSSIPSLLLLLRRRISNRIPTIRLSAVLGLGPHRCRADKPAFRVVLEYGDVFPCAHLFLICSRD
jgi:hypothetical protein